MPVTRPPPPTGTITTSGTGPSSRISSATVPCPAITAGSLNGWTSVRPVSASSSSRRLNASVGFVGLLVDRGAVAARRRDLQRVGALPHHDQRVDAFLARRPGDGLRVVARRDRDHAALLLLVRQLREPVERAAHLERARPLEELRLEADVGVQLLRERARAEQRRAVHAARDRPRRALDVVDGDCVLRVLTRGDYAAGAGSRAGWSGES